MMRVERSALQRVVRDTLTAELAVLRRTDPLFLLPLLDPLTRLGPDGAGLDSFEFITVAGAVAHMFGLAEAGVDEYLLARPTLAGWAELAATALDEPDARVTFQTSGSTGTSKTISHGVSVLEDEARFFADLLGAEGEFHVTVPTHHIYGFIFGVLVPAVAGKRVHLARGLKVQRLHASPGDVVVAFPYALAMLRTGGKLPGPGVTVVTSTAPCPPDLAATVREAGARLLEVYGSTETGGVGWRDTPGPYALLPTWHRVGGQIQGESDAAPRDLPDEVEWVDPRRFIPVRRRDAAVQVGGVNVVPSEVEALLLEHPTVAEASVRLMTSEGQERLKAFVVPTSPDFREEELRSYLSERLPAPARPAVYSIGERLPRDEMGKLQDWPV